MSYGLKPARSGNSFHANVAGNTGFFLLQVNITHFTDGVICFIDPSLSRSLH